jgi:hypothetical protein
LLGYFEWPMVDDSAETIIITITDLK